MNWQHVAGRGHLVEGDHALLAARSDGEQEGPGSRRLPVDNPYETGWGAARKGVWREALIGPHQRVNRFTRAGDHQSWQVGDGRTMAIKIRHAIPASSDTGRPVPRWAVGAAYASALSATIGFIPLHAVWALGIPLWADEDRFREWYADGGGPYLFVLSGMAVMAGVLALSLVRPWGLVFPSWVPLLAGRRVPHRTLTATAFTVSALLLLYTPWAAVQTVAQFDEEGIFSPWTAVYGIPHFLVWGIGLLVAACSYRSRTSQGR